MASVGTVNAPSTGGDQTTRAPAQPKRRRALWLALVVLAPLVLAGCQIPNFGAYHGATSQGKDAFKLWQGFVITGIVVGIIVVVLILWAVFRYRRRSDDIPRQTQYHTLVEIIYTVLPIITVLVLFAFTVVTENEVDATPKGQVQVKVTAFQWGWQFYYPQTGKVVEGETVQSPQMVVPVSETVNITLVSADVVHGFYVPAFNFSRYAQPGVVNHFNFNVARAGVYRGQCTQLCGLYHSLMFFSVKAVSPAQFESWVHQTGGISPSIGRLKAQIAAHGPGA